MLKLSHTYSIASLSDSDLYPTQDWAHFLIGSYGKSCGINTYSVLISTLPIKD